jgi:tetratricopeptide (TPR) repeat protein
LIGLLLALATFVLAGPTLAQDEDAELAELLEEERRDADRLRRRGDRRRALRTLDEHLDEDPDDAASRTLRALCRADEGDLAGALEDAGRALRDAEEPDTARRCARNLAHLLVTAGRPAEAVAVLDAAALEAESDARDAWALGRALWEAGERTRANEALRAGVEGDASAEWDGLLARGLCERRLGHLERASRSLVDADAAAARDLGREPDVLVALAEVYFEADGEIDHQEAQSRAPGVLFKKALDLHAHHEGALVGLFELARFNWRRQSRPAMEILEELLLHHPGSVEGLITGCSADLADGQLVSARKRLEQLRALCPGRREVRTLEAALAWIEHRREDTAAILAELAEVDPVDARPATEVARHLNELYRFAEALPFARAATERDATDADAWTQFGRALANTGLEKEGLAALQRAIDLAAGRQNAWRHNTRMVLARMQSSYLVDAGGGDLSYTWEPAAAEVLATYLKPFYEQARVELAERYGFTPAPTRIEVFGRHQDFSVRSTGFDGFPALGVCFGPVVTAVSPLSELRGSFSWARTAFHEFTHVVHLGLSHNRCPRWITEGLATWEEEERNPAWTRNMRRELVDALANGNLIPVRQLNRAFRGPRILFGYYQGGLLCRMLIEERGFPPMIRLLEAFDRGLDLDQALDQVYGKTPEDVDGELRAWVAKQVSALAIEPRWRPALIARKKISLAQEPPASGGAARKRWAEEWSTVAWGFYQAGRRVDAEQALRRIDQAGLSPARALFLRAEMALGKGDLDGARGLYRDGFAGGGEDFRARMALGRLLLDEEKWPAAEEQFLAAERAFPGFDERQLSAELHLAEIYAHLDRDEQMHRARERWLAWNSDEYPLRLRVARWHVGEGRHEAAANLLAEANEIDPFRRSLHLEWGAALAASGRYEEALRELDVALLVPHELDLDVPGELGDEQRAEILGRRALVLVELGRPEEAGESARGALELDENAEHARSALERLQ